MKNARLAGPLFFAATAASIFLPAVLLAEETIELFDGATISGEIVEVRPGRLVLETVPERTVLEIPFKLLSPMQQYKARTWRLKPGDQDPADPEVRMLLAKWCVEHMDADPRLREPAKMEFEKAVDLGKEPYREKMKSFLEEHGIMLGPAGEWLSADEYFEKLGYVKDPESGKYYPPEVWEKMKEQADRELKTKLLVPMPNDYNRITLQVLEAVRADLLGRDKNDKGRRIRFFAHFLFSEEDFKTVQAESISAVAKDKYVRLVVGDEDFSELYVERKKHEGRVARKLQLMKPGDRLQFFGKAYVTETGCLILVEDIVAW